MGDVIDVDALEELPADPGGELEEFGNCKKVLSCVCLKVKTAGLVPAKRCWRFRPKAGNKHVTFSFHDEA